MATALNLNPWKEKRMETSAPTIAPRIYVACLAAYNNGILHGAWIDADQDPRAIQEAVSAMLRASPIADAEEYAIHDHEGFGDVRIDEYTGLGTVARIAAFAAEHGELGLAVLAHFSGDLEDARAAMEDRYLGCFTSVADYMEDITREAVTVPEALSYYVDWEAMARDAEMGGDLVVIKLARDEAHIFSAW